MFKFPIRTESDTWFGYHNEKYLFTNDIFSYGEM